MAARVTVLVAHAIAVTSCHGQFRFEDEVELRDGAVLPWPAPDAPAADAAALPEAIEQDAATQSSADLATDRSLDLPLDLPTDRDETPPPDAGPLPDLAIDTAPDLASPSPPAPTADGGECYVSLCGWGMEEGRLECDGRTCSGSCGSPCGARCRARALCSLTAGTGASFECRENSTCAFVMTGGSVRCREGATCTVRCLGACSLQCEQATCRLQCASDASPRTVTGQASCS